MLLPSSEIFVGLGESESRAFAAECETLELAPGEVLAGPDARDDSLYVVHSGRLRVDDGSWGAAEEANELGPGDCAGELAFLSGDPGPIPVTSLTASRVLRLGRIAFGRLTQEHPEAAASVSTAIVRRLQMREIARALERSELLRGLPGAILRDLAREIEPVSLQGGTVLFRQGDAGDALYAVACGRLQVRVAPEAGECRVVAELGPGEIVGEMAVLSGEPRTATVQAMRDSHLARLSRTAFEGVADRHRGVLVPILTRTVVERYRRQMSASGRVTAAPRSFALVAAAPDVPLADFAARFAAALSKLGRSLRVSAALVDARLAMQGAKHLHHLNLAVIAALAAPYFSEIKIVEEGFEPIDPGETADLVGITMMTCQAERGYRLAEHFRRRGARTVCGGSHATFRTRECTEHFDGVVVNEVEPVWDELMADFAADRLKPVYRSETMVDLATLPIPRKDLFRDNGKLRMSDVIQAGRGCPLGCEFCTVTQMYGKTFRTRPVEHVVEEIRRFKSRRLLFVDDNIFLSRRYAYELFEALIPLNVRWGSQGSMELICRDEKLLELTARSGCVSLFVGIETIDQRTLDGAGKPFNKVRKYEEDIRKIMSAGINVVGSFIFGFEQDTPATFDAVLNFAVRSRLAVVNSGILTPFPGSDTYRKCLAGGTITDDRWGQYTGANLVWRHPTMGKEEVEGLYDRFRRRFYAWPSIARRFWANRAHPLHFLSLNLHLWWLYRTKARRRLVAAPAATAGVPAGSLRPPLAGARSSLPRR